jgi:hypothetical protein
MKEKVILMPKITNKKLSNEMKPWQQGFQLDYLKSLENKYNEDYNHYTENPFKQYKKHFIAKDLVEKNLIIGSNFMCTMKKVKVPSSITCYQDIEIGRKEKGDIVFDHIWGDLEEFGDLLEKEFQDYPIWIQSWREDEIKHKWLINNFKQQYAKIDTFGSILGIYFKDGGARLSDRELPKISVLETCPITQWHSWKSYWRKTNETILNKLSKIQFTDHYSNYNEKGSWSAISLRGYFDDFSRIEKPSEMNGKWKEKNIGWENLWLRNTKVYNNFPEISDLITMFFPQNDIHRIRFMKLAPGGGELSRHTDQVDPDVGATPDKLGRFHFPIKTNKDVIFSAWDFDGKKNSYNMEVGNSYYLDTRKPHTAINNGNEERVHLVIDVVLDSKLISSLEKWYSGKRKTNDC